MTVDEKLEVLKFINTGMSYTVIAEKFGIARSTLAKINSDASKLEAFKKRTIEMGFKKALAKMTRGSEYEKLNDALYI